MLSNFDLMHIAENYEIDINEILMKDELPKILNIGWYVINMQSSKNGNGTHWICLLYDDRDTTYFDSFGFKPPYQVLLSVAHSKNPGEYVDKREIENAIKIYNDMQIQDINDDNCGLYCIAIICFFKSMGSIPNRQKMENFQKLFSHTTVINKGILKNFLKEYKETYVLEDEED